MSFMPYRNQAERREELNRLFASKNPRLQKEQITLTKIIRLKKELVRIFLQCREPYVELYTVAHAWVLFERLIYKDVVRKHNRCIYLAICLYISIKLFDMNGTQREITRKLARLEPDMDALMRGQELTKNKLCYEIRVLAALHF